MNPVGDISVIKAILFKSCEKLETAQIDFDNGRYNDSVSRSYYTVFHAILEEIMAEIVADNISIVETRELERFSRIDAKYYNKHSLINKNGIPAVASVLSGRPE